MSKVNCCSGKPTTNIDLDSLQVENNSSCGCDDGCCDNTVDSQEECILTEITITIDGKRITITDNTKNLVEIAKEAGISIPAPCFLAKKKNGCCNVCVVEADDKQTFACGTKPKDKMNIIINRADLIALRKEKLFKYKEEIKNGTPIKCGRS